MNRNEILISQGNRPWWQKVMAAIFFTTTVIFLYYFFLYFNLENEDLLKGSFGALNLAIFSFATGVGFSVFRENHFIFEEKKYKTLICVGPVKMGQWKQFERLEYISVFKNNSRDIFEVNLWYNKNKHFNISIYSEEESALFIGKQLAKKLNIDLLDATNPHNSKWIFDLES